MEAMKRAKNVCFCTAVVELRSKSRIRIHQKFNHKHNVCDDIILYSESLKLKSTFYRLIHLIVCHDIRNLIQYILGTINKKADLFPTRCSSSFITVTVICFGHYLWQYSGSHDSQNVYCVFYSSIYILLFTKDDVMFLIVSWRCSRAMAETVGVTVLRRSAIIRN